MIERLKQHVNGPLVEQGKAVYQTEQMSGSSRQGTLDA